MPPAPVVLTIAGSDPSGSSGLQADLPTIAALGGHATSVVTVITAQNTTGVKVFHELPLELVQAQLAHLVDDLAPAATKTGLLRSREVVDVVAGAAAAGDLGRLVVDPVMVDSAGGQIVADESLVAYRRLIAAAAVCTPNRWEAELLSGQRFEGKDPSPAFCDALVALGCPVVVVTGGRGDADVVVDHVITATGWRTLEAARVDGGAIRGTGCTFSAAMATELARGIEPSVAPDHAHAFVQGQLQLGDSLQLGAGRAGLPHVVR